MTRRTLEGQAIYDKLLPVIGPELCNSSGYELHSKLITSLSREFRQGFERIRGQKTPTIPATSHARIGRTIGCGANSFVFETSISDKVILEQGDEAVQEAGHLFAFRFVKRLLGRLDPALTPYVIEATGIDSYSRFVDGENLQHMFAITFERARKSLSQYVETDVDLMEPGEGRRFVKEGIIPMVDCMIGVSQAGYVDPDTRPADFMFMQDWSLKKADMEGMLMRPSLKIKFGENGDILNYSGRTRLNRPEYTPSDVFLMPDYTFTSTGETHQAMLMIANMMFQLHYEFELPDEYDEDSLGKNEAEDNARFNAVRDGVVKELEAERKEFFGSREEYGMVSKFMGVPRLFEVLYRVNEYDIDSLPYLREELVDLI